MKIVAVHKFNNKITEYKLDTGKIIDTAECIQLVKEGKIEGYNVGVNRQGEEFVRSNRGSKSTEKENIAPEVKETKAKKTTQTQAVADAPAPKKRGRPRKVVEAVETPEVDAESIDSVTNLNDLPTF